MAENTYSIGEIVVQLKARWPEVTHSMVRFWEREELLRPTRTTGGHRVYCQADLDRLHLIANLRQRRYLPLGAVKRILQELETDPTADLSLYDELFRPDEYNPDFQPSTRAEAAKQTGISVEKLKRLESLGFLPTWCETGSQRTYDEDDLRILHLLRELMEAGLEPEDLVFFVQDAREHVRHETRLLTQVLGGCESPPDRRSGYRQVKRAGGQLRALLYRKYGREAISKLLERE